MATVAADGRIVAKTAKEAVKGFARLILGLACQNGIAAANMAIVVLGWTIAARMIPRLQPRNQVLSQHMVGGVVTTMMIPHLQPRNQVLSQQMVDGVVTTMTILQPRNQVPSQQTVGGVVMIMKIQRIQL